MPTQPRYRPMRENDRDRVAWLISQAFGVPVESMLAWIDKVGLDDYRVVSGGPSSTNDVADACLLLVPMGLFVGGKSVPQMGISVVATAPESRGTGLATHLMSEAVREIARCGAPLSVLYPATQPLYRRVGFEQAGSRFEISIDLTKLRPHKDDRGPTLRPIRAEDHPTLERVYRERARSIAGELDRGDYIWMRIRDPRSGPVQGWLVEERGEVTGWVLYARNTGPARVESVQPERWLALSDLQVYTNAAAKRVLALLADEATIWKWAKLHTGPHHPLLTLMPEQSFSVKLTEYWMLRVIDAAGALAARGYSPGMSAGINVVVQDELIPQNNTSFVLRVESGVASVSRGDAAKELPTLSLSIRQLAMLYTGFSTVRGAAIAGGVEGDDRAMEAAEAIFAGPHPGMGHQF